MVSSPTPACLALIAPPVRVGMRPAPMPCSFEAGFEIGKAEPSSHRSDLTAASCARPSSMIAVLCSCSKCPTGLQGHLPLPSRRRSREPARKWSSWVLNQGPWGVSALQEVAERATAVLGSGPWGAPVAALWRGRLGSPVRVSGAERSAECLVPRLCGLVIYVSFSGVFQFPDATGRF